MTTARLTLLAVALGLSASLHAAPVVIPDEQTRPAPPDKELPNVLILGDSISIGYTPHVKMLLDGKANVFRAMSPDGKKVANCNGTTFGAAHVDEWLAGRKWDLIHFNWGLHDIKHVTLPGGSVLSNKPEDPVQATPEQYARNLEAIVVKLKATGAKLVFATTTPVVPGTINPLRSPEAPGQYNAIAAAIMRRHGIPVNDLFAFCQPRLAEWQLPKNVHFNQAGSKALAGQVAEAIERALP